MPTSARCAIFISALELLHDPAGRVSDAALVARIEEQVGDLLLLMTRRAEARAAFERGLQLLPETGRVRRGNLLQKIGNTLRDEYHFVNSLVIYARALQELADLPGPEMDNEQEWWQCWIQIQIEILNVYYWLSWIDKSETLAQEMRPVVERFGTFSQKSAFYRIVAMIRLRANRYMATDEIVALVDAAMQISTSTGIEITPSERFGHGFALLLHGDLNRAEEEIGSALHLAEQRGDRSLETRCLTYLTIARRKQGDVVQASNPGPARAGSGRVCENARICRRSAGEPWPGLPCAAGTAHSRASTAWQPWRCGINPKGYRRQQHPTTGQQSGRWFQVSLDEGDLCSAFAYARRLLEPQRKGMPAELTAALIQAVGAWDAGQDQLARDGHLFRCEPGGNAGRVLAADNATVWKRSSRYDGS